MADRRVHVVGGGIVGASVAYHLSEEDDVPVTVYERGALAAETTACSAAFVGPGGSGANNTPEVLRMKASALRLYNDFLADPRTDAEYHLLGRLRLATTPEGADDLRDLAATLESASESAGSTDADAPGRTRGVVEHFGADELAENAVLPGVNLGGIEAALYRPTVAYVSPHELALEFVERARENGVDFETDTRVDEITTEGGEVDGLVVEGERVAAEEVVCAAGPWNARLAEETGFDLPVRHGIAPVLVLRPESPIRHTTPTVYHHERDFYFRPTPEGDVYVGHHPGGYDADAGTHDPDASREYPPDLKEEAFEAVREVCPGLDAAAVVEESVCLRTHTPDTNPIVGRTGIDGVSVAAVNASGIQLAPAIGAVVAGQLLRDEVPDYYDAITPTRFSG